MAVHFSVQTGFPFNNRLKTKAWIKQIIADHGKICGNISYIFTDDEQVLNVNKQYLNHDYYTDIITFDYVEKDIINGDIFISVDRVKDNAKMFNTTFDNELHRVIIHGVLHLLGFKDHSPKDEKIMRQKENESLEKFCC